MFDIDLDDLDVDDAAKAGEGLESLEFNVRRDACKTLSELADATKAAPFMRRIRELMDDEDYEVKKAAKRAFAALREKGVPMPRTEASSEPAAYAGPRLLLRIFKEVLPMRVEKDVTPVELTELWEKDWGVQYAGRLRFEAPEGSPSKFLNAREDVVPLGPAVVTLHCGVGSVMLALATALRLYGLLSPAEVKQEQERRREQNQQQSERRQEADAKEQERWRKAEMRRQQRQIEEHSTPVATNIPFVKNKTLGGHSVAGL